MKDITKMLHMDRLSNSTHGELHTPTYRNIAYSHKNFDSICETFQGKKKGYTYGRQCNPTVASLEKKISFLENSIGSICFSTGMNAIGSLLFALLQSGDHIIVSRYIFGNSRSLFISLEKFNIEVDFVDSTNVDNIKKHIKKNTIMVFVETIANPMTQVADLKEIGRFCQELSLVYVVDNTMTSPVLFKPAGVNASLVINSLSKYIGGHGTCLGGSVSDTGKYDWTNFKGIDPFYKDRFPVEKLALTQIAKKSLRDLGGTLSSDSANLISIGSDTLYLRVERICKNALIIAKFLNSHKLINEILYPGLDTHLQHEKSSSLFSGFGGILSFNLSSTASIKEFTGNVPEISLSSHLADNRTMLIPVAQTIFYEIGKNAKYEMGISESTVRMSVGIEDPEDICNILDKGLKKSTR